MRADARQRNFASARWLGVEVPLPESPTKSGVWKWAGLGSNRRDTQRVAPATLSGCRCPHGGKDLPPVRTGGHSPEKLLIRRVQGQEAAVVTALKLGGVRGAMADPKKCRRAATRRAQSSLPGLSPTNLGSGTKLGVANQDDHNCRNEPKHNHVSNGPYGIQAGCSIEDGACLTTRARTRARAALG